VLGVEGGRGGDRHGRSARTGGRASMPVAPASRVAIRRLQRVGRPTAAAREMPNRGPRARVPPQWPPAGDPRGHERSGWPGPRPRAPAPSALYLGGRLALAGARVQFVGRPRIVEALQRDGLRLRRMRGLAAPTGFVRRGAAAGRPRCARAGQPGGAGTDRAVATVALLQRRRARGGDPRVSACRGRLARLRTRLCGRQSTGYGASP
jgi:hypothetical protein